MKSHTITENVISILLGAVISIPICVSAYKDREIERIPTYENEPVEIASIEPVPEKVEVEEDPGIWIDGGYNDRVYIGEFKITAYCACSKCCGEWADGYTYTGTIATEGRTIAVDPEVIPLGSLVEINGINYQAEDIGGAIKGNRVDIFFNSHEEALEWGVQYHAVYMVEECLGGFF